MSLLSRLRKSKRLYGALSRLRSAFGRAFMDCAHAAAGVRRDKVVFSSFAGAAYSDNPRAVCESLRRMCPEARIVWQLSPKAAGLDEVPDGIRTVRPRSLAVLYAYATARVIVDNLNRPVYIRKYPDQVYIQTWHGDRGMKKVLLDLRDGIPYPDGTYMDLAVSGSRFATGVFRSAFGYAGQVLECGCPRNDVLVDPPEGLAASVRRRLEIPEDASVLLYAPTFRNDTVGAEQKGGLKLNDLTGRLERMTGRPWVALTRGHVLNRGISCEGGTDVSRYPEMSHLLLISDLLITDYSSCAGDMFLREKPVILYEPDKRAYVERDRSFYYDPDDSPYWVAHDEAELYALLERLDEAPGNARELREYFGVTESGEASARVAEFIRQALYEGQEA
ncbi:MAG: CDP-glycerol glycerophosphotransferase family protein [Clostridia bacterium]|nr:CDP-glycerol glycerophosphotransferase family protein [Clostridia bacterium]